jgi:RNA polymerase sigma-70 factor (ECF subfamily)
MRPIQAPIRRHRQESLARQITAPARALSLRKVPQMTDRYALFYRKPTGVDKSLRVAACRSLFADFLIFVRNEIPYRGLYETSKLMSTDADLVQVIAQAQLGDRASADRLANVARHRLFPYLYRLTLNYDLSQDLLQETLLKMVENLNTLQEPEHFWNWLFRTALGAVQHHYREQMRARTTTFSALSPERFSRYLSAEHDDGLSYVVRKELSQAVVNGIAQLNLTYRNVLVLRCYEQMSFAEIGDLMGCKELRARVLFFRAKHALSRRLARVGFGKGLLLTGLTLFEILSAPQEGVAAGSVTAASLKVGFVGSLAGAAGTPSGIALALTTMGLTVTFTVEHFSYALAIGVFALISLPVALYWR